MFSLRIIFFKYEYAASSYQLIIYYIKIHYQNGTAVVIGLSWKNIFNCSISNNRVSSNSHKGSEICKYVKANILAEIFSK